MAYDLHSYIKTFIGTQLSDDNANVNLEDGFVVTAGLGTEILNQTSTTANNNYGVGTWGLFDAKTYKSVTDSTVDGCCPLVLASASPYAKDKVSPFIGGYKETNKSRVINPRWVSDFYRTDPCDPQQQIIHIGNTNYTSQLSPEPEKCCFEFLCGQVYNLRIDIKGSPALRFLNHQVYREIESKNRCCSGVIPDAVDSTLIMIDWADYIVNDPILSQFLSPVVFDEDGNAWFAPGTSGSSDTWNNYVSPGHQSGKCAGLRLTSAYADTTFGNCTFQTTDFYEVQPINIFASMVDYTGDVCAFEGICVVEECPPLQGMGFGESAIRDLIMGENMRQFYFNTNLREREITQGTDLFDVIDRRAQYYRYTIIHSVPATRNTQVTGISADKYRLVIITRSQNAAFEAVMAAWLEGCTQCTLLVENECTPCTPVAI